MEIQGVCGKECLMSAGHAQAADQLEALRQLKARCCRFLDTKDTESCCAVSTGGADPEDLSRAG
jgi:hypothetical protein